AAGPCGGAHRLPLHGVGRHQLTELAARAPEQVVRTAGEARDHDRGQRLTVVGGHVGPGPFEVVEARLEVADARRADPLPARGGARARSWAHAPRSATDAAVAGPGPRGT